MSRPAPSTADVLVFFGATGDLAFKKIFPSLQAMVKRGHLDVPVLGVAKAGLPRWGPAEAMRLAPPGGCHDPQP